MYNIKIITVGKIKEKWLDIALADYQKRLSNSISLEWILTKTDDQLMKLLTKEKFYVCLDMRGKQLSSEEFSISLFNILERNKLNLTFVIGGAEGIPEKITSNAGLSISLSKIGMGIPMPTASVTP